MIMYPHSPNPNTNTRYLAVRARACERGELHVSGQAYCGFGRDSNRDLHIGRDLNIGRDGWRGGSSPIFKSSPIKSKVESNMLVEI